MVGTFPGAAASPSDFRWYYLAAHYILEGRSPYLATGYLYPPLTAFLFTPLAAMDYALARRVWWAISQASLLGAAWLLWKRLGMGWRSAAVVAFVWATGGAAEESVALGQIGALLTLMVVMAAFPGRVQAAAIAMGGAMKLIPGALTMALGMGRNWRALARSIGMMALLLVLPWLAVLWFLAGPKAPDSAEFLAGTPQILSWSAPSIVLRALEHPGRDGKPPGSWVDGDLAAVHLRPRDRSVAVAASAIVMMGGLAVLIFWSRGRVRLQSFPCAAAALIALALAASPVCWTHYEVLQYPGAAILMDRAFRERKWVSLAGLLCCWALLYSAPVAVLRAAYFAHGGQWPSDPPFLYFWTSISAIACLGLFGLAVRETR